ncbi:MAG: Crp/Fnr family transcriptional regulator [Flavobacteriales bacterium]|nr:Crp/Fnr family transcriptional regulator [Flavobacteriales bacterium]
MVEKQRLIAEFINVFEKELIDKIGEHGVLRSYGEGDFIMDIGNYIKTIPILLKGSIKIIREDDDGNEIFLYFIQAGETCAMSLTCCMQNEPSRIRAVAEEAVELIALPVHFMDEWMMQHTTWKNFVMRTYQNRFEELLNTIDLIAFHNMDKRLIGYLKEKSKIHQSNQISVTHQDIASELNSSREAISRLLKKLEKQGKVKLHRNRIDLID